MSVFDFSTASLLQTDEGWHIVWRDVPLQTPKKKTITISNEKLANTCLQEWLPLKALPKPKDLPLTSFIFIAKDLIEADVDYFVDEFVAYANKDMLFYRADNDEKLLQKQQALWNPHVDWFKEQHLVQITLAAGVMPIDQDEELSNVVRGLVEGLNTEQLAAAYQLLGITGSAILTFRLLADLNLSEDIWQAANLEQMHQVEHWGLDYEAEDKLKQRRQDYDAAIRFLGLCAG